MAVSGATAKPKAKPTAKPTAKSKRASAQRPKPAAKAKPSAKAKPPAKAKPARRKPARRPKRAGEAVAAVKRDLRQMPAEVAKSAEAATALAMAARLDSGEGSPSECAKALLAAMSKVREMCPPEERRGQLHAIRSGRADRLAAGRPAG